MNERIDDLVLLAALGELSPGERDELDRAMDADPDLAAEVSAELEVAAALLAASPVRAPATLRASVLAAVASTPQGVDDAPTGERTSDGGTAPTSAPVVSLDRERSRRRRFAPILSAAAAVVLLAVGAVLVVGGGDDGVDRFDEIAQADDARQRVFEGELAQMEVVYSASRDALVITGDDVPAPAADQVYVLWAITDDDARPIAEFRPDGSGTVTTRVDGVDAGEVVLGITAESAGGYDGPTLPILGTA